MTDAGRPYLLDDHKRSLILSLLKSGCSRATAASAVGCHPQTLSNTIKRDPQFAEEIALAENSAELIHIHNINRASRDTRYWRASAWMLERLNPDQFAKSAPNVISPSQVTSLVIQIAQVIVQEVPIAEFREQLLKRFNDILVETRLIGESVPNSPQTLTLPQPTPAEPPSNATH